MAESSDSKESRAVWFLRLLLGKIRIGRRFFEHLDVVYTYKDIEMPFRLDLLPYHFPPPNKLHL